MFLADNDKQDKVYNEVIASRRRTSLFSCGYYERYDPFLLEKKPFVIPVYEKLFNSFFSEKAGRILDLGCGTCFYWPVLAKYCSQLEGIDYSQGMLNEAEKLLGNLPVEARLRKGSSDSLPYATESLDAVIALDVLHHCGELNKTLSEVARVLRPGGIFFNLEPNMLNPVMFLAHICPIEERRATVRNWPWKLKKLAKKHFQEVFLEFSNIVVSAKSQNIINLLDHIDTSLRYLPLFKPLSFRFMMRCKKL